MRIEKRRLDTWGTKALAGRTLISDGNCFGYGDLEINFSYEDNGGKCDVLTITIPNADMRQPELITTADNHKLTIHGGWEISIWRDVVKKLIEFMDRAEIKGHEERNE